jgi:hypothetical protein
MKFNLLNDHNINLVVLRSSYISTKTSAAATSNQSPEQYMSRAHSVSLVLGSARETADDNVTHPRLVVVDWLGMDHPRGQLVGSAT